MAESLAENFKTKYSYFHSYASNVCISSNIRSPLKPVMMCENCGMMQFLRSGLNQESVVTCYASFPVYRSWELRKLARILVNQ
jgi:hypothetical protein